jgi:type VI secretion system protein ImpJ
MTWTNRVVWQEGMFLRAQHFQQQDRWLEMQLRQRTALLRPYSWGLAEIVIERELLTTGRFAVSAAAGIFEDGTPFAIPGEADHPPPLQLPADAQNAVVYLALPIHQPGAPEFAAGDGAEARYAPHEFEAQDTHSSSPQTAPLQVGRLRLRYLLETDDRSGFLCIGLARVASVAAHRRVVLDDGWIPPALLCSAAAPLAGMLAELAGMLDQRAGSLAARLTESGADAAALSWLQAINRWHRLIVHWADTGAVHPEDVYSTLVQVAGEFATFSEPGKRPKAYPPYRHDDLRQSFAAIVADLRGALSPSEPVAISVPLQERRYGVRIGQIADPSILQASRFVLVVRAGTPTEALVGLFRNQVKIAAVEHIRDVVSGASAGIPLRSVQEPPSQVPASPGAAYFELDRGAQHWEKMQGSSGFAIHVAGEFPNLSMELWAIRG